MKVHLHSRIALLYPGSFADAGALEALLTEARIELRLVGPEALGLTLAALAGYANTPPPTRPYTGGAVSDSLLVFSGLRDEVLNRTLDALRASNLAITHKAVLTPQNRNWALGTLLEEIRAEKQAEAATPEAENGEQGAADGTPAG